MLTSQDKAPLYTELICDCNVPKVFLKGLETKLNLKKKTKEFFIQLKSVFLILACKGGFYGKNCSYTCSSNCKTCQHTDGLCTCVAGWKGDRCTTGSFIIIFAIKQWVGNVNMN